MHIDFEYEPIIPRGSTARASFGVAMLLTGSPTLPLDTVNPRFFGRKLLDNSVNRLPVFAIHGQNPQKLIKPEFNKQLHPGLKAKSSKIYFVLF